MIYKKRLIEEGHINFITKERYTQYRNFRKGKSKNGTVKGRDNFNKMHRLFWEEVSNQMLNNEAGVLLDKIGYFYIMMVPKKMVSMSWKGKERIQVLNLHSGSRLYLATFVPQRNTVFKLWNMDTRFSKKITTDLSKKLKSGKVYKSLVYSLSSFLKITKDEQNRRNHSSNKVRFK